jgi:hypothetical protein
MSDHEDAPPSRVGQAVTPKFQVVFALLPDGQFALDAPDDEVMGRFLASKGAAELDRYYTAKTMRKMLDQAKENRVITGMMGSDAAGIAKKLRGLP